VRRVISVRKVREAKMAPTAEKVHEDLGVKSGLRARSVSAVTRASKVHRVSKDL